MAEPSSITITPSEPFEHLPCAPIVEAVIQLRARAEVPQTSNNLKAEFNEKLPEYSSVKSLGSVSVTLPLVPEAQGPSAPPEAAPIPEREWHGLRLQTQDGHNVAMFTRDYFSFSRLKPDENWETFSKEALRLWTIHEKLAGPSEVQRLGVRFINRFDVPIARLDPSDYLIGLVSSADEFPRSGFFYRDELSVPGHSYGVTLIRAVQTPSSASPPTAALLLDIDVFSHQPFPPNVARIEEMLVEMHWLKNRLFFDNVTDKALNLCR